MALIRNLDLFKTLYFQLRFRSQAKFIIFRKSSVKIKRNAIVQGCGKLSIGCKWPAYCFYQTLFVIWDRGNLVIKDDFKFHTGCRVVVDENAKLELGSGYMNCGGSIACFNNIRIGNGVAIADNVTIRDSDNHFIGDSNTCTKPIEIGDHVWIGMHVTILKGVTIGDGAIIAAGSVVNKNIPPKTLAAGVPARVVRENVQWRL